MDHKISVLGKDVSIKPLYTKKFFMPWVEFMSKASQTEIDMSTLIDETSKEVRFCAMLCELSS